ncbi:unnamed protein product, partial [Meganyctiphanes norvegica]
MSDTKDFPPTDTTTKTSKTISEASASQQSARNAIICDNSVASDQLCESVSVKSISHDKPDIKRASFVNMSDKLKTYSIKSIESKKALNATKETKGSTEGVNLLSECSSDTKVDLIPSKPDVVSEIDTCIGKKGDSVGNDICEVAVTKTEDNAESFSASVSTNYNGSGEGTHEDPISEESVDITKLSETMDLKEPKSKEVSELTRVFVKIDSLQQESERVLTFINWPHDFVQPNDLVAAGLFYLRSKDLCSCAFCHGILGDWQEGDIPYKEHKKYFAHCPFINKLSLSDITQQAGNLKLNNGEAVWLFLEECYTQYMFKVTLRYYHNNMIAFSPKEKNIIPNKNTEGYDLCGRQPRDMSRFAIPSIVPDVSDLGLAYHTGPMFRNFITEDSRIASFCSWPDTISQKPKALAEAGFFYINLSDHVNCFHCGGGLRNWRDAADPWTEHAKHYPQCNFVILMDNPKPKKKEPAVPDSQIPEVNDPKHSARGTGDTVRAVPTVVLKLEVNFRIHNILEIALLCRHLETSMTYVHTVPYHSVYGVNVKFSIKI